MRLTIFSSEAFAEYIQRNGNLSTDEFVSIVYECILNSIAYDECDNLKDSNSISKFKQRAKSRGIDGERKTAKELFKKYNLNSEELEYVSEIVISFVYKADRDSPNKLRNKMDKIVRCNSCGKEIAPCDAEIDHIHPYVYHGNSRNPSEYQILCHECNQWKKADAWFPLSFYCKNGKFPLYCLQKKENSIPNRI